MKLRFSLGNPAVEQLADVDGASDNEKPTPPNPHEERLRRRGNGPYYIAPDSAEALPESIWERIDLDELETATVRANDQLRSELSDEEQGRAEPPLPVGNYLPEASRDLLRKIGSPAARRILSGVDGESEQGTVEL